ncbi:hypothetical protein ICI42_23190 [Tianweitania sp. Rool2]|uniref:Uncharacterized protein n=1 Tax=Oryzicola mucosus TaxID=2767425 RepID=A0A8J6PNB0_9HYPH|nr:hypothetical protein [Oryzicola mucosus]
MGDLLTDESSGGGKDEVIGAFPLFGEQPKRTTISLTSHALTPARLCRPHLAAALSLASSSLQQCFGFLAFVEVVDKLFIWLRWHCCVAAAE